MKSYITFLVAALLAMTGCKPQKPIYPESIVGPDASYSEIYSVFNYDYEVRSAAFQAAAIYIDSGYVSPIHVSILKQYCEVIDRKEWEANDISLMFISKAYIVMKQQIPKELEALIDPNDLKQMEDSIEAYASDIKNQLAKTKAENQSE